MQADVSDRRKQESKRDLRRPPLSLWSPWPQFRRRLGLVFLKLKDPATAVTQSSFSAADHICVARLSDYYPPRDAGTALGLVVPLGPGTREARRRIWSFERCHVSRCTRAPRHMPSCGAPRRRSRSEAFSGVHCMEGRTQPPPEVCERLTTMVVAAMGACFLVSLAQMLVRIANDDASRRMFAVAFVSPWRRWLLLSCCFSPPSRSKFRSLPMAKRHPALRCCGRNDRVPRPRPSGRLAKANRASSRFETQSRGTGDAARHHHRRDDHERSCRLGTEEGIGSVESIAHNLFRACTSILASPRPDL